MRFRPILIPSVFALALFGLAACGDDDRPAPRLDSGPGTVDGGTGMVDGGPGGVDAGPGTVDSGPGPLDGGPGPVDSGPSTGGPITIEATCPAFTPCGGDLVGTWQYGATCVTIAEAEGALADACATATFLSGGGTVDGMVTFDATTVSRTVTTNIDVNFHVPSSCTMGFGCLIVGPAIQSMTTLDAVTCVDATGGCDCHIVDSDTVTESANYTVTGNVFQNSTTTRRWEYCVDGGTLTVHEIMSGGGDPPVEPGVQDLDAAG